VPCVLQESQILDPAHDILRQTFRQQVLELDLLRFVVKIIFVILVVWHRHLTRRSSHAYELWWPLCELHHAYLASP